VAKHFGKKYKTNCLPKRVQRDDILIIYSQATVQSMFKMFKLAFILYWPLWRGKQKQQERNANAEELLILMNGRDQCH